MSWSIGYDDNWKRNIGYGVPATCDHPGCGVAINRGLAHVCRNQMPFGGVGDDDGGCGLYFCHSHLTFSGCERCEKGEEPFEPTPDVRQWIRHKLRHASWAQWREENPDEVERLRKQLEVPPHG